jgi:hypothetical protein
MANYTYRCSEDGPTVTAFPVGTAPSQVSCPMCGEAARRIYTAPMMSAANPARMNLIDSTHATADAPEVVTSIPRGGRINSRPTPMAPPDPRLKKLPRP